MLAKTRLSPEELRGNFDEVHPPLGEGEAVVEAGRCLWCYDAPCTRACPTHIDVPRFIRQILHGDTAGAAETILEENVLGGSCARACPTEVLCEGACVDRTLVGAPVQIGRLQRFATDHAAGRGLTFFEPGADTGRRVAVIGSGPSGLSCAFTLRRLGHAVTVFEGRDIPGGLNTLGIAAYKISTEFALTEVARVEAMGVEIRLNEFIDGARLARLREEYDAVFIGVGLGKTATVEVPGTDLQGVQEALEFIFPLHTGPLEECRVGRHVVVVGAGNTAIDVSTQARRLGAESVTIAYRRTEPEMSAFAHEVERARRDGVRFEWQLSPMAFVGANGHVTHARFEPVAAGTDGRLVSTGAAPVDLPCDQVVMALGQTPILDLLHGVEGIRVEDGRLVAHDTRTGAADLFAGGDCLSRGGEIVDAVQDGKVAAHAIDARLKTGGPR